jgi:dTDP-4-amino-4,6-dideoxygalactose transaminase
MAALQATIGTGAGTHYVIMPAFTFIAAAQAVMWTGHRPLFVDVDPDTWQPAHAAASAVLEDLDLPVAGILLANVFGVGNPDIDAWERLAHDHGLPLVIDSAAGFGSWYADGTRVGGRGTCEVFSLHATKPFGVGEGGAVVSRDPDLITAVEKFQNFGFDGGGGSGTLGLNAKLPELAAAIGLRQLVNLDERLERRRDVFATYREALGRSGFDVQPNAERSSLCFGSFRCASAEHKTAVMRRLAEARIDARDYYNPPIHQHTYFANHPNRFESGDLSVTEDLCARVVSAPIHDAMDEDDLSRVVAALTEDS